MPEPRKLCKPYPGFPLTPHSMGYWVKVINGKQHRIGKRWATWQEALEEWNRIAATLDAGDKPRPSPHGLTLHEGLIEFLTSRKRRQLAGEITARSYDDYETEARHVKETLGGRTLLASIGPADFAKLRKEYAGSPTTIGNRVGRVRVMFNYMYQAGLVDRPVRFGPDFAKPSAKTLRKHRAEKPKKLFTPTEIHQLVAAASPQLRCMIYLGLYAGFGNSDCGAVRAEHFHSQWVEFPRPKTGIHRKAWLPADVARLIGETIQKEGVAFVTKYGNPWSQDRKANPVSAEFRKVARPLGIKLGFYSLRHTCQTIGDRAKDPVAVSYVMGHVVAGMSQTYREEVDDGRLQAVGETIRDWLAF